MDCSPPVFAVCRISQARVLECIAISSSGESSWPRHQTCISCIGRQILYHWAVWLAQLPKAVITTCILYWEIFPPSLETSCHYRISNRTFVFENLGWCYANWFFWTERTPVEVFHPGRDIVRVFEFRWHRWWKFVESNRDHYLVPLIPIVLGNGASSIRLTVLWQ